MTELWINNKRADLTDDNLILFTYSVADANDPAVVMNSYSQPVKLPRTPANENIFQHYGRADFRTTAMFNPKFRNSFIIRNELGNILERGYMKLDTVDDNNYNITLYGGLGGYFYALIYNNDGTKKTLADLKWYEGNGNWSDDTTFIDITKSSLRTSWENLPTSRYLPENYLSWAPCYNGYPENFDADKAYYKRSEASTKSPGYTDVITNWTEGGKVYTPKNGSNGGVIVKLPAKQTEWEMQELRVGLQRPVWKVQSFFYALANNAANRCGFNVVIPGDGFFEVSGISTHFTDSWVTLPPLAEGTANIRDIFKSTKSPGEYLLSFAKLFGLMFVYDRATSTITICDRNSYYRQGSPVKIELGNRIARDKGIKTTPLSIEDRLQEFSVEMNGERVKAYEEKYGKVYGSKTVDTGNPFNSETNEVLSDVVFKGAADVLERSSNFVVYDTEPDSQRYHIKQRTQGKVSWTLYNTTDGNTTSVELEPVGDLITSNVHQYSSDYRDFFPKIQLHGEDNKAEDGSDVLLFYVQNVSTPKGRQTGRYWDANFYLTENNYEMLQLNDGVPCWDITCRDGMFSSDIIETIPQFSRLYYAIEGSMEIGVPQERYTSETTDASWTIYARAWKKWIEEKSNKDVRKVTCYVDLRNLKSGNNYISVGPELLRNFYTFDNALWALEEIKDFSLNTNDLTECTFVKVLDINNYTIGQSFL